MKKVTDEEYEIYTGDKIEMTWRDLYWSINIIDNGTSVSEEYIKIITIGKEQELVTTSGDLFVEFETIRLSAPKGKKYAIYICDDEMRIEMVKSN